MTEREIMEAYSRIQQRAMTAASVFEVKYGNRPNGIMMSEENATALSEYFAIMDQFKPATPADLEGRAHVEWMGMWVVVSCLPNGCIPFLADSSEIPKQPQPTTPKTDA